MHTLVFAGVVVLGLYVKILICDSDKVDGSVKGVTGMASALFILIGIVGIGLTTQ